MVMAAIFIFRIVPWKDPGSIRPLAIFLMSLGGQRTNSCMFYIFYPKSIQTLASRCLSPICSRLQRKNTHTNTQRKHLIRKPDRGIVRDWSCQGIGSNSYTFMLPWLHSEICGCSLRKANQDWWSLCAASDTNPIQGAFEATHCKQETTLAVAFDTTSTFQILRKDAVDPCMNNTALSLPLSLPSPLPLSLSQ